MTKDVYSNIAETLGVSVTEAQRRALEAIFEARSQLAPFFERKGELLLPDYGEKVVTKANTLSHPLKEIVTKKIKNFFGPEAAINIQHTLDTTSSIDTSGHGGIFSEDTLLQSHAILAEGFSRAGCNSFVSFACGVVPMNNNTWPRGFFIQGERESIFPKSFDRMAVHECPAFNREQIEKKLSEKRGDSRAASFLELILSMKEVFEVNKYFEQATILNQKLWLQSVGEETGVPRFYQILLEDVSSELIIHAIENEDPLSKLIFCKERFDHFFELMSQLPGTWSIDKSKGTYLFWHASGDFRSASLWKENDFLANRLVQIPFEPEAIKNALRERHIVPSVFLSLITLLHNGVRPLGGYHQLSYLAEYRKRLMEFSESTADLASCPDFLSHIQCISLFNLGYGFAFYPDPENPKILAGVDAFLGNRAQTTLFWSTLRKTNVTSALVKNLKRLYLEIVPAGKREKELIPEL